MTSNKFPDELTIYLTAEDYGDFPLYGYTHLCPVAAACNRTFKVKNANEYIEYVILGDKIKYFHDYYGAKHFQEDRRYLMSLGYEKDPATIVRELKLTKQIA